MTTLGTEARWAALGDALVGVLYFMACPLFAAFLVYITEGF